MVFWLSPCHPSDRRFPRSVDHYRRDSSPSAIFGNPTVNDYSSYYRDAFGHSRSLRAWLAEEETKYVVAIQERLELIKRWGPREDAVDP
jgi:hypothetical protein